ncbi:MAG TPA: 5-(carboxyamino)imidazole ribonucleotide synthase [Bacteroidota bacterium]|nr:5-(carboxyamino)imidazole ribonucleotide synthase [Bacteroidota bacterium]
MTQPILPPATIGVIGGGQLGMMTLREAQRMGYRTAVWDPDSDCPASRLSDITIVAPFTDSGAAGRLADVSNVVTYEFENVDPACVDVISRRKPILPGSAILKISRHRKLEKETLNNAGFPVIEFRIAKSENEIRRAVEELGLPVVVKTTTAGYDGKGQTVLHHQDDLNSFCRQMTGNDEFVVEKFIALQLEVSVIAVRENDGTVITFPVLENEHRENILHVTRVPARISEEVEEEALRLARSIINHFRMIGVLCVEMFVTPDGRVLVNELAPRPHNSGHFSLDACSMSQFEALVRSICSIPMQEPRLLSPCAMVNLLGKHLEHAELARIQSLPGTKVHIYGKKKPEPRRKMGHVTIVGSSPEEVDEKIDVVEELIGEGVGIIGKKAEGMVSRVEKG